MTEPVRQPIADLDPNLALFDVGSVIGTIGERGGQRRGLTVLLGTFAAFALLLSALALYASLSYSVVQRQSELAVRMALSGQMPARYSDWSCPKECRRRESALRARVLGSFALGRVLESQVFWRKHS